MLSNNLPVFPVLFQHKVKLRYLCCHGLVIQIFYCKGSCHLISVSVVDRIYQFREDIFFPHRFQHALIHIIGQLFCGCRRVQLEKGSEKFVDFLRGDGIHRTVTLYRFWGVTGFYRNAGDGWVLDNCQVSRTVHIDRHLIGRTDGFTGFPLRCNRTPLTARWQG